MTTANTKTAAAFDCKERLGAFETRVRFLESSFTNSYGALNTFLGDVYSFIQEIGSDGERIKSLDSALIDSRISVRQRKLAKTVAQKVSLCVFVKDSKDFMNKSTRSLYTRALADAVKENLDVEEFVATLNKIGIYAYVNPDANEKKEPSTESVISFVETRRRELLAETASDVSSIGLIGGKNPSNTFAVVLYRVDNGTLVPCKVSDADKAVNAFIREVIVTERAELEEKADLAAKEAAEAARNRVLSKKAA